MIYPVPIPRTAIHVLYIGKHALILMERFSPSVRSFFLLFLVNAVSYFYLVRAIQKDNSLHDIWLAKGTDRNCFMRLEF